MKAAIDRAAESVEPRQAWWESRSPWIYVLVFAAALVAYWPALGAGFIWDDAGHVTRPALRGLSGLWRIWSEPGATQQYYPFLHSAFWLEYHLWGGAALGYHLLNLLLHSSAACLLIVVLRRLGVRGSLLAGLLFALHPVAVESVAWVSEQKNTLSALLYLCAVFAYLRFDADRRWARYWPPTLIFLLALATKTVTASLPAALLVVFWWRNGRLDARRDVVPLLPWFALSLTAGMITSHVERTQIGASGVSFDFGFVGRCLIAGRAFWFYAWKLVWPARLMFVYPRWTPDAAAPWQYLFPAAALALIVALGWKAPRGATAGVLFFAGTLFPALGFVNVYPFIYSFVADHFQYLADLGIWALAGAASDRVLSRVPRRLGIGAASCIAVTLGSLTRQQTRMYHDVFVLYETTLARNPGAWMAETNLGIALADAGRLRDAIPHYESALKLRPDYPEGENNLGYALTRVGEPAEAIPHLKRALDLHPGYVEAENNLGIALMQTGQSDEGRKCFEAALRLKPHYAEAHQNLGLALASAGRTEEAIVQFKDAVRDRPDYGDAEMNWAVGLTLTGRFSEAVAHFERAIRLSPGDAEAHSLYGRALARYGRYEAALAQYRAALALAPDSGEAHMNVALMLRQLGRLGEAAEEYRRARELRARGN